MRLDPATREVTLGGEPVALTPREYELLEYLLRHPDRVVTKRSCSTTSGTRGGGGDPNAVEVYVGYLRRKLGAGWSRRCAARATASVDDGSRGGAGRCAPG